jgi:hypothetical protein
MRLLLISALAAIPVLAQNPTVELSNNTRPASRDFQIGDRFEIVIAGARNQPVSVKTTMQGRTDWGPIIAWTDSSGRWSTTGQFERSDFGDWSEVFTVGGKLANPAVHYFVGAPCLPGGQGFRFQSGPNITVRCETAEGTQTFGTPSEADPFRTPDGRLIPGRERSNMTAEQYHAEVLESQITGRPGDVRPSHLGDQAGALIAKIVGVNALSEDETRNVLAIIHAAFEKPNRIPEDAKDPSATLHLLQNLADFVDQPSLKQQIADTVAYVQAQ